MSTVRAQIISTIAHNLEQALDGQVGVVLLPGRRTKEEIESISDSVNIGKYACEIVTGMSQSSEAGGQEASYDIEVLEVEVQVIIHLPNELPNAFEEWEQVSEYAHAGVYGLYAQTDQPGLMTWGGLAQRTDLLGGGSIFEDEELGTQFTLSAMKVVYRHTRGNPNEQR